jgi:hypothetical protein
MSAEAGAPEQSAKAMLSRRAGSAEQARLRRAQVALIMSYLRSCRRQGGSVAGLHRPGSLDARARDLGMTPQQAP